MERSMSLETNVLCDTILQEVTYMRSLVLVEKTRFSLKPLDICLFFSKRLLDIIFVLLNLFDI